VRARTGRLVGGVHPDWVVSPDDPTGVAAVVAAVPSGAPALVVRGSGT